MILHVFLVQPSLYSMNLSLSCKEKRNIYHWSVIIIYTCTVYESCIYTVSLTRWVIKTKINVHVFAAQLHTRSTFGTAQSNCFGWTIEANINLYKFNIICWEKSSLSIDLPNPPSFINLHNYMEGELLNIKHSMHYCPPAQY